MARAKSTAGLDASEAAAAAEDAPDPFEAQRLELEADRRALELRENEVAERETALDRHYQMRTHETHEASPVHASYDDESDFEEVGVLDTSRIPPRDGYVQRWIRTHVAGEPDISNVQRQINRKWRPRKADTVPEGEFVPTIQYGNFGDVIGVEGMLLMERPTDIHARHGQAIRRSTAAQMESVDNNLFREHRPGSGLGMPRRDHQSSVDVGSGRPMPVAAD